MSVSRDVSTSFVKFASPTRFLRTGYKTVGMARLISLFILSGAAIKFKVKDSNERMSEYLRNASKYASLALNHLGFSIEVKGMDPLRLSNKSHLLVSNHMSYLDALVVSSVLPCAFVTSEDMGEQIVLGDIAEFGGSIFIERRHRDRVDRDLTSMAEALSNGFHVMIYPEGTSSDGSSVLPFKKSLLMSAVAAGVDIQPVVIKYREIEGRAFCPDNRDIVCWYGKMDFASHLLKLLTLKKGVKVELEFLEPVAVKPDSTRQELAEKSYSAISEAYLRDRHY